MNYGSRPYRRRRHRTPEREMLAWKRRLRWLERKESRCAACRVWAERNADTLEPRVCPDHQRVRRLMALG